MKTKFRLAGLSKEKSMTVKSLTSTEFFWPKVELSQDRFDALWDYISGNWNEKFMVVIEHEGFYEGGIPINPVVIGTELD